MSLDRGGRTSIKPGFKVIMSNQDKLDNIQRQREEAENRLNEAIYNLEQLGVNIEIVDKYHEEDDLSYSKELMKALRRYIDAKNKLNTFP